MPNFASIIKEKSNNNVVLYRAVSRDGRDFYAYIRCNEKQSRKMKQDFMTRTPCKDVSEYGEVLYTGLGTEPDEAAKEFLAEYLKSL